MSPTTHHLVEALPDGSVVGRVDEVSRYAIAIVEHTRAVEAFVEGRYTAQAQYLYEVLCVSIGDLLEAAPSRKTHQAAHMLMVAYAECEPDRAIVDPDVAQWIEAA